MLINLAAFVVIVAGIMSAKSLLIPFLLAFFLAIIFAPPLYWLRKKNVPQLVAVALVVGGVIILQLALTSLIGSSLADFTRALPQYQTRLQVIVREGIQWVEQFGFNVTDDIIMDQFDPGKLMGIIGAMLNNLLSVLTNTFIILLTFMFIMLEAAGIPSKLKAMAGGAPDVPESAKGWAATILFNDRMKSMFQQFYDRPDTFTLGICNGCQLFALLGWVPWQGLPADQQPRFVHNKSGRFESRWTTVKVANSKAMMLQGMEDLIFGIHVDHGEGKLHFPDQNILTQVDSENLVPLYYVDDEGQPTEAYPFNPNGSPQGFAGLCSPDGRHLAMMPHPERVFLPWQAHWLPEEMNSLEVSPWLQMFQNAYQWCMNN